VVAIAGKPHVRIDIAVVGACRVFKAMIGAHRAIFRIVDKQASPITIRGGDRLNVDILWDKVVLFIDGPLNFRATVRRSIVRLTIDWRAIEDKLGKCGV
jgi:hypothetical protein